MKVRGPFNLTHPCNFHWQLTYSSNLHEVVRAGTLVAFVDVE